MATQQTAGPTSRPHRAAPPGPGGSMAGAQAPPFRLPGQHFAAALLFLTLGAAGLILFAEELARGAYPSPPVIAVTHLFTLGWITTSIMGALYQFMPVALGQPVRSVRLAHVSFWTYVAGLPLFVGGLATGSSTATMAGALTFATGLVLFLGNLGATLAASTRRDVTWWALTGASVFLAVTIVLGLALTGNLRWGYLGENRFLALGVHLHVALGGWVLLVMVGVAHRLLPMFLLAHGVGDGLMRAAVGLIAAGAGTLAVLHHGPALVSRWAPALLLGGGLACFLVQAARLYRRRLRPPLDPGMRLAALALGLLALGLALAGPVVSGRADARLATAYVLVIVGGITLFIAAHYYKIVPFLVWYHRFGPLAGKQPVPKVSGLYHAGAANAAAALLALGICGLAAGVVGGNALGVRAAAIVFASGVLIEGAQMLRLAGRRPT